jgi:biopolymer transport protein ExbB
VDVVDIFRKGGPAMWPLLALSILSLSVIIERLWFWFSILTKEKDTVERVLEAARENPVFATGLAKQATDQPIGRFLYAPLQIAKPNPEVFRLALEAKAEDELAAMRRGDKVLEAVIALAPLLGLLGTVLGLIRTLSAINLGNVGTSATAGAAAGIGESLICTATGLIVAIFSLTFYRLFQGFLVNQVKVFRKAGSDLELLYLQSWSGVSADNTQPDVSDNAVASQPDANTSRRHRKSRGDLDVNGPAEVGREGPEGVTAPYIDIRDRTDSE